MIQRFLIWAVSRYLGGEKSSSLVASGVTLLIKTVKSVTGRRELVDVGKVKPGQRIVIEHLHVTHKKQIRSMKAEQKALKRAERSAAAEARALRRAQRRARRRQLWSSARRLVPRADRGAETSTAA